MRLGVNYGFLYTRNLEICKSQELKSSGDFNSKICLSSKAHADLEWWANTLVLGSPCPIRSDEFEMTIFSDSSLTGWGAECHSVTTKGLWSPDEVVRRINYLELLAAFFAIKSFAKDRANIEILIKVDNTTALSYIIRM